MQPKTCKYCGCGLTFLKTKKGKWMPCERKMHYYHDDPHGRDTLILGTGEVIRCTIDDNARDLDGAGFKPHWGSCPVRDKKKETGQLSLFEMAI